MNILNRMAFALLFSMTTMICNGAERPNIILMMADDLGWSPLGPWGLTQTSKVSVLCISLGAYSSISGAFFSMVTSTLAPSRKGCLESRSSMRIRTGIRCVTLTQLPVVFCGGSNEKEAAELPDMLSTTPLNARSP